MAIACAPARFAPVSLERKVAWCTGLDFVAAQKTSLAAAKSSRNGAVSVSDDGGEGTFLKEESRTRILDDVNSKASRNGPSELELSGESAIVRNSLVSIGEDSEIFKRSDLIAKQVISVSDASSVGFVSQLWVDTRKWQVKALELKPSLLFGEVEGVFLSSLLKVGDVVLVEDEEALEGDLRLPGFDGMVGSELITEDGDSIGKIRDYVFNFPGGGVTYLEFDSIGISLVPSNMVSTYCLMIEDVVEAISSETILVRSGAQDRIRRLTKGLFHFPRDTTGIALQRRQRRRRRYSYVKDANTAINHDAFQNRSSSSSSARQAKVLDYSPRELNET